MNKEKTHQNQTQCVDNLVSHFKSVNRKHRIANIIMGSTLVLYFTLIAIMIWG